MSHQNYFEELSKDTHPHFKVVSREIVRKKRSLSIQEAKAAIRTSGEPLKHDAESILLMMVMKRYFILTHDGRIAG